MNIDFTLAGAVIITGLVVVFVALIGLSLIVWLIGKLFVSTGLGSPKKPAQPAAAPKPAAPAAPKAAPQQAAAPAPAPAAPAAPAPENPPWRGGFCMPRAPGGIWSPCPPTRAVG